MKFSLAWACAVAAAVGCLAPAMAQEPTPPEGPSLDAQLLEDLQGDLLEGIDLNAKAKPTTPPDKKDDEQQPASAGRGLPENIGEDIGAADAPGDEESQLARIERKMRQVERRLAQRDASTDTQSLQRQIADELAALLKQLQQQQQSQSNSSSQQQQRQQSSQQQEQQRQDQPQNAKSPSNQPASKPARESEERTGKNEEKIAPEDLQELFQKAWGNLPPQVRERMQAAAREQFLPQYQTLIEDYYKRLAEEGRR